MCIIIFGQINNIVIVIVVLCNTRKLVKHNMPFGLSFSTPTDRDQSLPRP